MKYQQETPDISDFFQWVQQYFGFWTLICTPDHEHMKPSIMVDLIEKLSDAGLDELIFVLLSVHRNEPFVAHFYQTMLFDLIAERWETDRKHIIDKLIAHLQ